MEAIPVKFDLEGSKKAFKKYFDFEERKLFKKIPSYPILAVGIGFIIIGLIIRLSFLTYMGIIINFILGLILIYYKIQFKSSYNKFIKDLEKHYLSTEKEFIFKFNNKRIIHESENTNTELTWKMIKRYETNEGDIYLFLTNNQLYDIISESIIGKENFEKFQMILNEKVKNSNNS